MKILHIICKVVLSLIITIPIVGATGLLPEPTADLYSTPEAFAFIQMITDGGYIAYINAIIFLIAIILLWTKRELLAALLILPITVNIIAFHAFLDGGLLTMGSSMANVMLLLNVYFIWIHRQLLLPLFAPQNNKQ
jgi:putative oxidoreductase